MYENKLIQVEMNEKRGYVSMATGPWFFLARRLTPVGQEIIRADGSG